MYEKRKNIICSQIKRNKTEVHKVHLSAILDLYDRRIVSYIISDHNDNPIVFNTFKAAVKANPDAQTPMSWQAYQNMQKKIG